MTVPHTVPVRSGTRGDVRLRSRQHPQAGFTLAEMLIAATLGALLLTAAASSAGTFTEAVARIETESVDSYENVLARIDRDVRYAWWVDVPAHDRLQVVGPDNLVTVYHVVGNDLLVTRPDGSSGSILTGLDSLSFDNDTMQRLRSNRTTQFVATMASVHAPASAPTGYAVSSTTTIALSFMGGSDAGPRMVAGVDDRYTYWLPTSLDLNLARVGNGTITFTLYPAFGPGRADPRPGAAAIATWSYNIAPLPAAVVVTTTPRTLYAAPAAEVSIPIPALAQQLEPGVAYTLLVNISAGAQLVWAQYSSAARTDEMSKVGAGAWTALPFTVAWTLRAEAGCTTTEEADVTTQVRTTLQSSAGGTYVGSACVYSQILAEDPWLGVVPGELPSG